MPLQFHNLKHFKRLHSTFLMNLTGRMTQSKLLDALVTLIKGRIPTTLLGDNGAFQVG